MTLGVALVLVGGCSSSDQSTASVTNSPRPSSPQTSSSASETGVSYAPAATNACGLAGDQSDAYVLNCIGDVDSVIRTGTTAGTVFDDLEGFIPEVPPALFGDSLFVPYMARIDGQSSARVAVWNVGAAKAVVKMVDVGEGSITAAGGSEADLVVGTSDGEIQRILADGSATVLGKVSGSVKAVAASEKRVWFVGPDGGVGWLGSDQPGQAHVVGTVKSPKRGGVAVIGDTLWVLTAKGNVARFDPSGAVKSLTVKPSTNSLMSCGSGVWARSRLGSQTTMTRFSADGASVSTWNPPAGAAYVACAGDRIWTVDVEGALYQSP